jgi:ornithine cyclodeaminase/alanine dehydrogenase-like protein (mu-crystallin family)
MRLISEEDVERLIDPQRAIAAAAEAYRRHAAGMMPKPGRLDLKRENPKGGVLVLAGHSHDRMFAVKSNAHSYPDTTASSRNAASLLLLWDAAQSVPLALIGTTGFNNHRTAAGFAAAAEVLAHPEARTLAVFGAGKIAPACIRYLTAVRRFDRLLIAGRGLDRARALVEAARQWSDFASVRVEAVTDPARTAKAADVIVTVTTSDEPVFPGDAVRPGTLVILGGANRPTAREADDALIRRSRIFVDHLDGCLERAGDLVIPLASGALSRTQISGEIGALIGDDGRPRVAGGDVTVFKSIGIAAQDLVTATMLFERAEQMDVGIEFNPRDGSVTEALAPLMRTGARAVARGAQAGRTES